MRLLWLVIWDFYVELATGHHRTWPRLLLAVLGPLVLALAVWMIWNALT